MYDVITGNIPNARGPEDPYPSWEIAYAVTRAQAKKGQGIWGSYNGGHGGHMGIRKTNYRILSNFYWPGLNDDVARFCGTCDICQKTESKGKTAFDRHIVSESCS